MYIWIFSFSPRMLHKPVAAGMMHRATNPSSIRIITLSVNSAQLRCKYFCWESGCYSCGGSTQSRPSWDEPKHIPSVTVYLCWEEAWATALWHFIKQITGTLQPRDLHGIPEGEREGCVIFFVSSWNTHTHIYKKHTHTVSSRSNLLLLSV